MIGDTYKIKYSDYLTSGRYILIEATDRVSRPGINTTNVTHPRATITDAEITQAPPVYQQALIAARDAQTIDMTFYGYRASGYGAQLWNNLFNLLENYAQPSATTSTVPLYSRQTTLGQIWVNTSSAPTAYWYGRTNAFYKLGASINIATDSSQVLPGELWFDPSSYTFKFYSSGWNDVNCIPYVSQTEYNQLVDDINVLTVSGLPKLTGTTRPTPDNWAAAVAVLRLLGASNGISVPAGEPITTVIAGNFTSCNHNSYGISAIRSVFSQIRTAVRELTNTQFPPSVVPLAGFTASPTIVITSTTPITFTDTSLNTGGNKLVNGVPVPDVARYSWDFGDPASGALNTSTTAGNVTHMYNTLGTYTVRLTVTNSKGSTSSQAYVQAVTKPVASFTVDKTYSPTTPFVVQFTDTSTNGPTSWLWDFGDGTTSSLQNPLHEYTTQDKFDVTLTASNMAGSGYTTMNAIDVQVGDVPNTSFTNSTASSLTSPFIVNFTDTSDFLPQNWVDLASGEPQNGWIWTFGDGATSNLQNPSHQYTTWGRYSVSLTAANPVGVGPTVTKTNLVEIGQIPQSSFTRTPAAVTGTSATVTFTDTTLYAPTSWSWDFGDPASGASNVSTAQHPSHYYASPGVYTVTLTTSNALGPHTYTMPSAVQVGRIPVAEFTNTTSTGWPPLAVTFTDTSQYAPTSWLWNFGDGTTSTQQNPVHTYSTAGVFTVSLITTNVHGSNTVTKNNLVETYVKNPTPTQTYTSSHTYQIYTIGNVGGEGPATFTPYGGPRAGTPLISHARWPDYAAVDGGGISTYPSAAWLTDTGSLLRVTSTSSVTETITLTCNWHHGIWNTADCFIYRVTPTQVLIGQQNSGHVSDMNVGYFSLVVTDQIPPGAVYEYRVYLSTTYNGDYKYNLHVGAVTSFELTHTGWV